MTADRERPADPPAGQWDPAAGAEEDLPGDPACLLRRVCPACGAVAGNDPPTTCPQCHQRIPAA